jgi:hypothetical protein
MSSIEETQSENNYKLNYISTDASKRKSLIDCIKERLVEYSQYSSYHGIPNLFRTNNIVVKVLWIIFFLVSAATCFYLTLESIWSYLAYDVTTKIVAIPDAPSTFPEVVKKNRICIT